MVQIVSSAGCGWALGSCVGGVASLEVPGTVIGGVRHDRVFRAVRVVEGISFCI